VTGFDLPAPVRDNRVLLIRYRSDFAARLSSATLIDPIIDELRRLIGWVLPARLVIDSLSPFLNESGSGALLAALVQWLERVGATTLLTWPGDVSQRNDARLDLVIQRAATITHFARNETGAHSLHIVQNRVSAAPAGVIPFLIKPGMGMVLPEPEPVAVAELAAPVARVRRGKRAPLEIAQTS
jgi:KaiC/GvpD/RAD55 family RecA-like ATPase